MDQLEDLDRDLPWLAATTDVPLNTLHDAVKRGPAKVDVAVRIAQALSMSLDEMLQGIPTEPREVDLSAGAPDLRAVPIIDVTAAAGDGSFNEHEQRLGVMYFPDRDLRRYGTYDKLRLLRARGDSMHPEIRDGDLVMFDLGATDYRSGVMVINRDGLLIIKRLEMIGASTARLLSDNRAYDPIDVDLSTDQLTIVGRVVWAGKAY